MSASTDDPAILIDLLQAVVSQTHWLYAELWAPSAGGRLMTQAVWWRKGRKHDDFTRLERLSRSLSVRPGSDLAGRAFERGEMDWQADLSDKGSALEDSPRQDAILAAGMLASLSLPVCVDGGTPVAVVVLLSQRVEFRDDAMAASATALCASAAPFLQHLAAKLAGDPDDPYLPDGAADPGANLKGQRLTIKYPGPTRQQFRAVNADVASPGVSPARLAQGPSPTRPRGSDPRTHQRGAPLSYMTQLTTALQGCRPHAPGAPDPIRCNVAWVVLEQLAQDVGSYSEVLARLVAELRPALFSEDIIAMDDGMSMVRAPFFTQLAFREQQVRDMDEQVRRAMAQTEGVAQQVRDAREEADQLRGQQALLKRQITTSERQLVKIKLTSFLERRVMEAKVQAENEKEMKRLQAKITELETALKKDLDSKRIEMVHSAVEREYLHESVRETGTLRPPMKVSLMDEPVIDDEICGPWQVPLIQEEEGKGLKTQMLILRNACLTEYENKYLAEHDQEQFVEVQKPAFIMQMDELESEIAILDEKLEEGWNTPRYELLKPEEEAKKAVTKNPAYVSTRSAFMSISELHDLQDEEDDEEEEEEEEGGEEEADEEEMRYWTDKGSKHAVVNIWRGYEKRMKGRVRELPRNLKHDVGISWVYEIFEEKVRLDVESQQSGNQKEYVNIEKVFYDVLDKKYGSKHVANLVAYDFLMFIDANRMTVKLLHLFAVAMSGGWYDADWKYILRVQQFIKALSPTGFPNLLALDEFMVHYFYFDQPQSEIARVLKAFTVFPTYNMQLAEGHGDPAAERVPAELFSEFVAYLLEINEEPRLRKVMIMVGIQHLDQPVPVSYEDFERFANMCVPLPLKVEKCQLYYRMMMKAHPDKLFPPQSLAMAITSIELEVLLEHFSVEGGHLFGEMIDEEVSLPPRIAGFARASSNDDHGHHGAHGHDHPPQKGHSPPSMGKKTGQAGGGDSHPPPNAGKKGQFLQPSPGLRGGINPRHGHHVEHGHSAMQRNQSSGQHNHSPDEPKPGHAGGRRGSLTTGQGVGGGVPSPLQTRMNRNLPGSEGHDKAIAKHPANAPAKGLFGRAESADLPGSGLSYGEPPTPEGDFTPGNFTGRYGMI